MINQTTEERARRSGGRSDDALGDLVEALVRGDAGGRELLVDVGAGQGALLRRLADRFARRVAVDAVAYGEPHGFERVLANLDRDALPLPDGVADVVTAIEVIEHLENPRQLMRELVRVAKPGGRVLVTTPNQLSLLSKLTLVLKNEFNAFQAGAGLYPAHITALLESDLRHIAKECGLQDVVVSFSDQGRVPFTARRWPSRWLKGRSFSDNVLLTGTKPRVPR